MSSSFQNKAICLMGPTASGKTALAIDLVQHYPCEIISVDSAMVYKGMDIGTAKPTPAVLEVAPHHLIDIRDPRDAYNAADFCEDASALIKDIFARGKIPLLVGGTMMYFKALQTGISDLPASDALTREKILSEGEAQGWQVMHERLAAVDPISAERIHNNDVQRIQRALEVFEISGKSLTQWQQDNPSIASDITMVNIVLSPLERSVLHERIALRFQEMLALGFVDEVKSLFDRGDLHANLPSMRSVGYRQAWDYLLGDLTMVEMTDKSIIATRQLAKRQLTWLRNWHNPIQWFDSLNPQHFTQVVDYLQQQHIF